MGISKAIFKLRQSPLFRDLDEIELKGLISHVKEISLEKGEYFLKIGGEVEFFFVEQGKIEICRRNASDEKEIPLHTFTQGQIGAETAFVKGATRETSIKALEPSSLLIFSVSLENRSSPEIKAHFFQLLTNTLQEENGIAIANQSVENIHAHIEQKRSQKMFGTFNIYLVSLIFIYLYAIEFLVRLNIQVISTTFLSVPILSFFGALFLWLIKSSGYPLLLYGVTLKGSGRAIKEALLSCIPVFSIAVGIKWSYIHLFPAFHQFSLFHISSGIRYGTENVSPLTSLCLILLYTVFVPIQEFIFRGIIQGRFEEFLLGKHKTLQAILLSNFPFSMVHLYFSLPFALWTYAGGCVWGWLYARHGTLVGCSLAHFLTGIFGFFIVGVQDVLIS